MNHKPFSITMNIQFWGAFHLILHYSIYFKVCYLNQEYKKLNHEFLFSSSPYIQSRPNRVCEFCLVNIYTRLFEMMCHLYYCGYKWFNNKYVHIIKPNVLHLNKDFFFWVFFFSAANVSKCWLPIKFILYLNFNRS